MKKRSVVAVLILVVAGTTILATVTTYPVRTVDNNAQLLWNTNEAYLFIGTSRLGWKSSYLKFGWDMIAIRLRLKLFGGPAPNVRSSFVVLRITPGRIEQYGFDNASLGLYTGFDGHVYEGPRRKWTGTRFEQTTAEEERRFRAAKIPSGDFSDVEGWSSRCCVLHRRNGETRFPIQLGGQPAVLTVVSELQVSVAIDLQRHDQPTDRLWSLDERPRSVSKAEYQALFSH